MKNIETADILKKVGKRVRECRQMNGMTQADLAAALGKSTKAVQRYESGKTDLPLSYLVIIAKTLDISLDYLIGCSNARTQDPQLKAVCGKTGLSDKAANMLSRLKKDADSRLCIINYLLEQADNDIDNDDYDLEGRYNGSVLSAVIRYLEQIAYDTTNNTLDKAACKVLHQLILCQVVEALWETGGQL